MGRRTAAGGVTPLNDRIQIRFTLKGCDVRPTLDLKPTAANLKHAKRLRDAILQEIKAGVFDLSSHFPDYRFAGRHEAGNDVRARTLNQWSTMWVEISARNLEHSTLTIYKRHLKSYWLSKFGDLPLPKISYEAILRHLSKLAADHERNGAVVRGLSRKTQNNILIPLRAVFQMACKVDKYLTDPTEGIENLKVQKAVPDPFSPDEVEAILDGFRKDPDHGGELADYFEFSFFAGLRSSEQIALLWSSVDLRSGTARVCRSRVLAVDKERTKTTYARDIELNGRALGVLERQRARTQLAGEHVFLNPWTSRAWNDEQEQRRAWIRILKRLKVRYRPPKECRDTSVTLALMAGADPVWVANQHGHSVQVMLKDYARWIPKADRGRNLATVNQSLEFRSSSAVETKKGDSSK